MEHESDLSYDSFVIRVWHEARNGRLLRAEVNHVQTGAVSVGREDLPEWILGTLLDALQPTGESVAAAIPAPGREEERDDG